MCKCQLYKLVAFCVPVPKICSLKEGNPGAKIKAKVILLNINY